MKKEEWGVDDFIGLFMIVLIISGFILFLTSQYDIRNKAQDSCERFAPDWAIKTLAKGLDYSREHSCVYTNGLDIMDVNYLVEEYYLIDNNRLGKMIVGG